MNDDVNQTQPATDPQQAAADLAKLTEKPTESFADIVEEFDKSKQVSVTKGGVEAEPQAVEVSRGKPVEAVMEIPTEPEVEKKLEGYIEKVEKAGEIQQVVVDDYTQQVLMNPVAGQGKKITLPLTEEQVQLGLHQQVWAGIRWLAEWCVRQIKMLAGRAEYKK
jgi:hypothetical protein